MNNDTLELWIKLAILEIKKFKLEGAYEKNKIKEEIMSLQSEINSKMSYDKARKIYCSNDYTNLYNGIFNFWEKFYEN